MIISLFLGVKIYSAKLSLKPYPHPLPPYLDDIIGWLLFFIVLIILQWVLMSWNTWLIIKETLFDMAWLYPTDIKESINPQFLILLDGIDKIVDITTFVLLTFIIVALFRWKKSFPLIYIWFSVITLAWAIFYVFVHRALTIPSTLNNIHLWAIAIMIVRDFVCILFLLKSKRVKALFTRD